MSRVLLGGNIDHIATVRNARVEFGCHVEAALIAEDNGADGNRPSARGPSAHQRRRYAPAGLISVPV